MKLTWLMLAVLLHTCAGAQVRRDPFARPAGAAAAPAPPENDGAGMPPPPPAQPRLRAVMYEPGKSLVNINGRILAVGDRFDDYRIVAITAASATLTRRGVRRVIALDEESKQ